MQFNRIADKKRIEFIKEEICRNVPAGDFVLDVGCGNGVISKAVAEKGYKVIAIDVSEKTVATALKLNPHPNIIYQVSPAGELKPEPSKYSAIICSEVLEHLQHPAILLNILQISLRDDGLLLATVPNGYGPRELLVTRPVQYLSRKNNALTRTLQSVKRSLGYTGQTAQSSADDLTHVQFFTMRTLRKLAVQTGFQITRVRKTNFIEQVFPFSLFTRRSKFLQKLDCAAAEILPLTFTSGFMTVWIKRRK